MDKNEKTNLVKELFIERTDTYLKQVSKGYQRIETPITDELIAEHLAGNQTISVYFSDRCKKFVIDIDLPEDQIGNKQAREELRLKVGEVLKVLEKLKISKEKILIEFSGRRGYHLWIFFEEPIRLLDTYNLGKIVEKNVDFEIEIFPKQFYYNKDGFISPIKLPLGIHQASRKWSTFVNEQFKKLIEEDNWKCLQQIQRVTKEEVKKILEQYANELLSIPENFQIKEANKNEIVVEVESTKYELTNIKNLKDGIKVQLKIFNSGKLLNQDSVLLSSGHCRQIFVNRCKEFSKETKEIVLEHLLNLEQIADYVLKEKQNRGKSETEKKVKLSHEEIKEAEELAKNPRLLYEISQATDRIGVAGEKKNSFVTYLGCTSRKLDKPISITLKGESAGGKSIVSRKNLLLMPEEDVIELTDATTQSFYYLKKSIANKIIMISEIHGIEKTQYSIRILQSEKKIKIQFTVKSPYTGEFETKEKEVDGPVMFLITTTLPFIHNENETRNLSVYIDESIEQTKLVFGKISDEYKIEQKRPTKEEIRKFINLQRILKPYKVIIPYVDILKDIFPVEPIRVRRDFGQLLAIIEVIALLHQYQRKTFEKDGVMYLETDLADYYYAKIIAEETLWKTIYGLPPKTIQIIQKVEELAKKERLKIVTKEIRGGTKRVACKDTDEKTVTYKDLSLALCWNVPVVKKWLQPAEESGFLAKVEGGPGRARENHFKRTEKQLEEKTFLPTIEQIKDRYPELKIAQIFDPFSGENFIN